MFTETVSQLPASLPMVHTPWLHVISSTVAAPMLQLRLRTTSTGDTGKMMHYIGFETGVYCCKPGIQSVLSRCQLCGFLYTCITAVLLRNQCQNIEHSCCLERETTVTSCMYLLRSLRQWLSTFLLLRPFLIVKK